MNPISKIFKLFFIIYIITVVCLAIAIKYSIDIIYYDSLFFTFNELISLYLIIFLSVLFGIIIYHYGFYNKKDSFIKSIIGYLSFIGSIIFINFIFSFSLLIGINNLLSKNENEKLIIDGTITKFESYKLSKKILVKDSNSGKIFNLSVNNTYDIGENFKASLNKGFLNIYYK